MVTRITNGKVLVDGHFIEADVYIDGKPSVELAATMAMIAR